jgi:hypothetical protein
MVKRLSFIPGDVRIVTMLKNIICVILSGAGEHFRRTLDYVLSEGWAAAFTKTEPITPRDYETTEITFDFEESLELWVGQHKKLRRVSSVGSQT